jgi:hypothetical protein
MAKEKAAGTCKSNSLITTEKLENILWRLLDGLSRSIQRGQLTGAWLSVFPTIVNGTELSAEEFRDALTICYGELPSNIPHKCDGCDAHFALQHALGCKKGGLVNVFCHNKVRDKLAVRNKSLIQSCYFAEGEKASAAKETNQQEPTTQEASLGDRFGDLLIQTFWTRGTDCILDVHVTDTDAKSYCKCPPAKVLESQEREKQWKYQSQERENNGSISRIAASNDIISLLLYVQWTYCLDEKLLLEFYVI